MQKFSGRMLREDLIYLISECMGYHELSDDNLKTLTEEQKKMSPRELAIAVTDLPIDVIDALMMAQAAAQAENLALRTRINVENSSVLTAGRKMSDIDPNKTTAITEKFLAECDANTTESAALRGAQGLLLVTMLYNNHEWHAKVGGVQSIETTKNEQGSVGAHSIGLQKLAADYYDLAAGILEKSEFINEEKELRDVAAQLRGFTKIHSIDNPPSPSELLKAIRAVETSRDKLEPASEALRAVFSSGTLDKVEALLNQGPLAPAAQPAPAATAQKQPQAKAQPGKQA